MESYRVMESYLQQDISGASGNWQRFVDQCGASGFEPPEKPDLQQCEALLAAMLEVTEARERTGGAPRTPRLRRHC